MNVTEPIRDNYQIQSMVDYLRARNLRNLILFLVGIYSGLRIGDELRLRAGDVRGSHITLREQKTGKHKRLLIAPQLKRELKPYIENLPDETYLFPSRQGIGRPISRKRAYAILKKAARANGVKHFGCHSMRKTFGHHAYKRTKNVGLLMELFNHSRPEVTLRYIGHVQDQFDDTVRGLDFTI